MRTLKQEQQRLRDKLGRLNTHFVRMHPGNPNRLKEAARMKRVINRLQEFLKMEEIENALVASAEPGDPTRDVVEVPVQKIVSDDPTATS